MSHDLISKMVEFFYSEMCSACAWLWSGVINVKKVMNDMEKMKGG